MRIIFISAVSGIGKTTTCEFIKNSNLLDGYNVFDIDDLENVHDYDNDTYNLFYENAIKKAVLLSNDKNIIIGSCINPNDIEKINIPEEVKTVEMILITCSEDVLYRRLKARDVNRNCGSDEFIKGQVNYQNYLLNHLTLYNLHLDNSDKSVEVIANEIIKYLCDGNR